VPVVLEVLVVAAVLSAFLQASITIVVLNKPIALFKKFLRCIVSIILMSWKINSLVMQLAKADKRSQFY
jgi:hypothetical protein